MTEHIRLPLTQGKHDGNIVFDTDGLEFCSSYGPVYETRARAAYIVQACNAYPALLEACKADREYIRHLHICPICKYGSNYSCPDGVQLWAKSGDLRDAAIAAAEAHDA